MKVRNSVFLMYLSLFLVIGAVFAFRVFYVEAAIFDHVQSRYGNGSTLAFLSNTSAGNTIIIGICSTPAQTVSDTQGNAYTLVIDYSSGQCGSLRVYYAHNIVGGANTITFSGGGFRDAVIAEFTGDMVADVSTTASGGSSTPDSGNTTTTTSANELIYGFMGSNSSTPTAGTGFLLGDAGLNNSAVGNEYKKVTSAGTYNATFNPSASFWDATVVTFKQAPIGSMKARVLSVTNNSAIKFRTGVTNSVSVLNTNTTTIDSVGGSPYTGSHTVNSGGSKVVAIACIAWDNTAGITITGVTYGGQAMTSAGTASVNTGNNISAQAFYLVNPPTGSNTVSVSTSGSTDNVYIGLTAFQNVNLATPVRPGTYQSPQNPVTTGAGYSLVITSTTNDMSFTCTDGGTSNNVTTNQTSLGVNTNGFSSMASDRATTPASSVTHTWTGGGSGLDIAIVGFSIQPSVSSINFR